MKRPEKQFWYFVLLMSSVILFGLGAPLASCARAETHAHGPYPPHSHQPDPAVVPWNQPSPTVSSSPGVKLSAQLDRTAVMHQGDGIVRMEVNIDALADQAVVSQASDIVVVVDTSGSMSGQKLEYAKRALFTLFERLRPEDRFSLVSYSNEATVLVPLSSATPEGLSYFRQVAAGLSTSGSTNMSAGIDVGAGILSGGRSLGRPGRLLLLSDGLANAGDSSEYGLTSRARSLAAQNFALSSIGIGQDFDENLMTKLATAGTGAFYYLAKLGYLASFFDGELASARETIAMGAELRFMPAPGVRLEGAMGLHVVQQAGGQNIQLGSLYSGRKRTLWLTLRVPTNAMGSLSVGKLALSYQKDGLRQSVGLGNLPNVLCLNDPGLYHQHINRSVWERAVLEDVFTQTEEEFGDAIRTGNKAQLHGALTRAEQERKLAQALGSRKVIDRLAEINTKASVAERAQSAPAPVRNSEAKKAKARAYQLRNRESFKDADHVMEAY